MPGQTGPLRPTRQGARVGAGLVVGGLLLSVATTACTRTSVKDAAVVVSEPTAATVIDKSGAAHPARDGEQLRRGDRVRTENDGRVILTVRSRRVLLGEDTDVIVPDGASVELTGGELLVDRRDGPAVTVHAGDATIDRVGVGALRVERTFVVELAVYSGGARITTTSWHRLDVGPLHQAVVSSRALPAQASPLQLRGDRWEEMVIPGVVVMDEKLTQLARGIDAGWSPGQPAVVPAVFGRMPADRPPSETMLPKAIGEAAARNERSGDPFTEAAEIRAAGGSWGVVAALLDTDLAGVGTALADLLRGVPPTPVPAVPGGGTGTPQPQPGGSTSVAGSPQPDPTWSRKPTPTVSPTVSPSPTSPVGEVIREIERNLPTPRPTPTATPPARA